MKDQNIELPPLPVADGYSKPGDVSYSGDDMQAYARQAIEADRKRRGEPVYCIHPKCLTAAGCSGSCSKFAPQPAEPKSVTKRWQDGDDSNMVSRVEAPAEPVKCQDPSMGEHACSNRAQCWEPCGELGKSAEHARAAEPVKVPSVPEPCTDTRHHERYIAGWNACRAAMLGAAPTPPADGQP